MSSAEKCGVVLQDENFFEGAEKLLEIWFTNDSQTNNTDSEFLSASLRSIPIDDIRAMLTLAECRILHSTSSVFMDSYVLSESSMFVSDERFILKTCGNTKLLRILERIRCLAQKHTSLNTITRVYYSRKNFLRPNLQPELHRHFEEEAFLLDKHFPGFFAS